MTTRAQIDTAMSWAVDVTSLDRERIRAYCRVARRCGYTSTLEQITAVVLARLAPAGARGPKPKDPIVAAIQAGSPLTSMVELARLRSEIRRAGTSLPRDPTLPRDLAALAQQCIRGEAHRRYPGDSRWQRVLRKRWRDGFYRGQGEISV